MPIRRTADRRTARRNTRPHRLRLAAAPRSPAAPGTPTEISVSLFGTFGYDEVGLFKRVRGREPRHHDPATSPRRARTSTGRRCRPGSRRAAASPTCRASRSPASPTSCTNQADKWTDLRDTPAKDAIGRYIDWKEKAATTPDGAVLGLGTDIGPMGICYRTRPARRRPACRPTPRSSSAQMPDWNGFLALGEKYKAAAPAGTAWHDSAGGLYNAIISSQQQIYYDASGNLVYATNPAVRQAFDTAAKAGQAGPDRQAGAVPRPRLGPGLRLRPLRHHRLPVLDDRLHQGQGR